MCPRILKQCRRSKVAVVTKILRGRGSRKPGNYVLISYSNTAAYGVRQYQVATVELLSTYKDKSSRWVIEAQLCTGELCWQLLVDRTKRKFQRPHYTSTRWRLQPNRPCIFEIVCVPRSPTTFFVSRPVSSGTPAELPKNVMSSFVGSSTAIIVSFVNRLSPLLVTSTQGSCKRSGTLL